MERIEEKEMAAASADTARATDTSVDAVAPASALPTSAMSAQALAAMAAGQEIDPAQFEFGGMLASQIGADMSDERDGKKKDPEELEREEAMRAAALDIPQGTAATRQRKALALLRLELGEEECV